MFESQSPKEHLDGIARALATSSSALVRVENGSLVVDEASGNLALGPWLLPFLQGVDGDLIVYDPYGACDTNFAEALDARGIHCFAAARLSAGGKEYVCAFDAERKTFTAAQRYILQALGTTLAAYRELLDLRGRYREIVTTQKSRDERVRLLESVVVTASLRTRVEEAQHEALAYRAFHDDLTGLRNRAYFVDRLGIVLREAAHAPQHHAAVIFLDVDHFKLINDSLGHSAGDVLLVEIARRLTQCLRPGDTLARLGGDEFTVLVERVRDLEGVIEVATRILGEFRAPVRLGAEDVYTSASLGIAFVDARYTRAEDVLRDADSAMYRAKRDGGMRYACFDDSMNAKAAAALALQMDLRRAVERDEFVVHYQPVIDMADAGLAGFEALVRWNHPERGLVHPGQFIGAAEELGLITAIGEFVLRRSCADVRRWNAGRPALMLSVNVSPRQFHSSNFYDVVVRALGDSGLSPQFLQLEITENLFLDRACDVGDMLGALRRLGVRIALDDFGTGYSSLNYLERFEVDTLKIDRSFVARLETSTTGLAIVGTIVGLARALRINVVGEGVETQLQLEVLRSFACDQGQGFLFGRAADARNTERMLGA